MSAQGYGSFRGERNDTHVEEEGPLLHRSDAEKEAFIPDANRSWAGQLSKNTAIKIALVLVFVTASIAAVSWGSDNSPGSQKTQSTASVVTKGENALSKTQTQPATVQAHSDSKSSVQLFTSVVSSNEYGEFDGNEFYPWLQSSGNEHAIILMEPYKYSAIRLVESTPNAIHSSAASLYSYKWEFVKSEDGTPVHTAESTPQPEYVFRLTEPANLLLHVSVTNRATKTLVQKLTATVYVRYVKRELRELSVEDRDRFLNAAAKLWEHDTDSGRAIYGDDFTSVGTFVEEHALASNDIRCDAFHEGTGFLTRHLALQLSFETSLRAVDPAVTLPYWDFTIEGQQINDVDALPSYMQEVSPFFSNEWFGAADENNHIINSRWAHLPMYKASDPPRAAPNSYGFLRSYWNNNAEPEITRHMYDVCDSVVASKPIPFCDSHYAVLNTTSLYEFLLYSPAFGHGPMHVQTGGVGGSCGAGYTAFKEKWNYILSYKPTDEQLAETEFPYAITHDPESVPAAIRNFREHYGYEQPLLNLFEKAVMHEYFHIYRTLWRSHMCAVDNLPQLLHCPERCSLDTPMEDCKCSMPGLEDASVDWRSVLPCVMSDPHVRIFSAFVPDEFLKDTVFLFNNNPVIEGEMVESASPADILFWVIHPAIERLILTKKLTAAQPDKKIAFGNFEVTPWTAEENQWQEYSYYDLKVGENKAYPEAYTCVGHAADDDVLPDKLVLPSRVVQLADTDKSGKISNWEFYQALDLSKPDGALDYVYNHFRWSHCDGKVTDNANAADVD